MLLDRTSGMVRSEASRWSVVARRVMWVAFGVVLASALAGCIEDPKRDILDPVSDSADISAYMYNLLLAVCSVIMVIVAAWFTYSVVRFRKRPDDDGELPPQIHGHTQLEVAWTIIPTLIVIAITIPTIINIFELERRPGEGEPVTKIEVIGKQWWWEYNYKDEGFMTANEMHVEVGTTVQLEMTAADVIHAFWVPQVTGKRDATPGRVYEMFFNVREPGEYIGQCAELCGSSHALMGIKLFAHPKEGPNSYAAWVASQKKAAEPPRSPEAQRGKELFMQKGCMRCHNISGDARTELHPKARRRETGPDLTHVGSRTTIAALTLKNTRENIARWVHDPQSIKQGALMGDPRFNTVQVSKEEAEAIASYLFRLK